MSRTIRSSHAANESLAARAIGQQAHAMHVKREQDQWRNVLARRDARKNSIRTLHSNITQQRRQMGSARVFVLTMLTAVVGAVLTIVSSI